MAANSAHPMADEVFTAAEVVRTDFGADAFYEDRLKHARAEKFLVQILLQSASVEKSKKHFFEDPEGNRTDSVKGPLCRFDHMFVIHFDSTITLKAYRSGMVKKTYIGKVRFTADELSDMEGKPFQANILDSHDDVVGDVTVQVQGFSDIASSAADGLEFKMFTQVNNGRGLDKTRQSFRECVNAAVTWVNHMRDEIELVSISHGSIPYYTTGNIDKASDKSAYTVLAEVTICYRRRESSALPSYEALANGEDEAEGANDVARDHATRHSSAVVVRGRLPTTTVSIRVAGATLVDEGVYYLQLGTTVSTRSDRTSHPHFAHTFSRPTVSMTPMRVEVWKVGSMKNKRVGIVMVDPALGRQGEWTGQLDIVKGTVGVGTMDVSVRIITLDPSQVANPLRFQIFSTELRSQNKVESLLKLLDKVEDWRAAQPGRIVVERVATGTYGVYYETMMGSLSSTLLQSAVIYYRNDIESGSARGGYSAPATTSTAYAPPPSSGSGTAPGGRTAPSYNAVMDEKPGASGSGGPPPPSSHAPPASQEMHVTCPVCQTVLIWPPGAQAIQCPCGQVLQTS